MKAILLNAIFLGCFLFIKPATGSTAVIIPPQTTNIIPYGDMYKKITTLKLKDFQKLIGRKLSLKEKIGFLLLKHKLKQLPKEERSKGHTAMVFGIVGLGLFVLSFFVPYVIIASMVASIVAIVSGSVALKADKNDRKAFAGKLMGLITLGLILILLILAVALIASLRF